MQEFISNKKCQLKKFILENTILKGGQFDRLLSSGDVKVNKVRVKQDIELMAGDKVEIYIPNKFVNANSIEVVYIDENIVIINKPVGIEIEGDVSVVSVLSKQLFCDVFAVHRLDRNTGGLVILALNRNAVNELKIAFKEKLVDKYYLAVVVGNPLDEANLNDYLFKDADKSLCIVSSRPKEGYLPIITQYKLFSRINDQLSLLLVKLVTGRTHQIRAHLAFVGLPILGDGKYGIGYINKQYKVSNQLLSCIRIKFNFDSKSYLHYLDGKQFEINEKDKLLSCINI